MVEFECLLTHGGEGEDGGRRKRKWKKVQEDGLIEQVPWLEFTLGPTL